MRNIIFSVATVALALVLSACNSVEKFDYTSAPGTMTRFREPGSATKSVAVMPFMDQRGMKGLDSDGDQGSFFLGFIPLIPTGFVEKEQPENSDQFVTIARFHFDVRNDLAAAAIASLKASGLFSEVTKANNAAQAANADYIWRGSVNSTFYRGCMFSYCITYFFSPVLWVVGAPFGSSTNELGVNFELVERATGKVVWSYKYLNSDYINHWIYARYDKDVSIYPRLMKEAMNGALYELHQKMPDL